MGKYFGTDGVRGIANEQLTPELAFKIGRCGGYALAGNVAKPTIIIGRDTRISGHMLSSALTAGLLSIGANVITVGIATTPSIAYLTRQLGADAGVMISASHNPFEDNGIKFFGHDGYKLSDETEAMIEQLLDADSEHLPRPTGKNLGKVTDQEDAKSLYIDHMTSVVNCRFDGLKIVLDCAHGAAYEMAPRIFSELGAELVVIGASPDGLNINDRYGSTQPENLQAEVVKHGAHLGLSFDGDADRLIAVDETGALLDGDHILCICGSMLKEQGLLKNNLIVTTVMSNFGFFRSLEQMNIQSLTTGVGDRYVMEAMRDGGYNFGGEQSGHIIFLDHNTTGDGILSGLKLAETMLASGKKLSELKQMMTQYPQILINIKGVDKSKLQDDQTINEAIVAAEQQLGSDGRVLVRPSGTEDLVRVMVEGPDEAEITSIANKLATTVEERLKIG